MFRLLLNSIIAFLSILFSLSDLQAQVPVFAIGVGGTGEDHAHRTTVDNNGNIIVTGRFNGTADFDPGAAVFNLTSNGSSDIFVAKYTGTGAFIWAFKVGGTDRDGGYGVAVDGNNNIYITGYFRNTADFDPSAATANLVSNGHAGFDPGWSGDIFVARYTPNGNYVWAFNVGGSTIADDGQEIIVDHQNNVIITGFFSGNNIDFDPSPTSSFTMTGVAEEMFLAKYSSNGNFVWAKQMGTTSITNETIRQLDIDDAGNIYVTGFFSNEADFDPGPGVAQLTASSVHEGFIAAYSPSGDYGWAYQFGGTGFNQGWSIDVEGSAIYIAGTVQGTGIRFTAANGTRTLTTAGGNDAFFAKYSLTGNLLYVNALAGAANEEAYDIAASSIANCVYVTGIFQGTADFAPGAQTANLTSTGGSDVFVGRYTLDGSYLAAFKIGSGSEDFGFAVRFIGSDLLVNGSFMGSNVDFDPGTPTLPRSSAGNYDGFVARYTFINPVLCSNWLRTPSQPSYVDIGDLDVPGTSITVEAQINRTAPYSGGNLYAGDIVTKHDSPADANYLLRPNSAQITTSNGHFITPEVCPIELNKTYHVAMTYDGATLKFYRNGFLLSQIAATGTLFQNNWKTRVGYYEPQFHPTQFVGYTNEVRIWNVVRTQDQLREYMNTSLPATGHAGLLAYYVFDNLLNKQGNAAWNGTLGGPATINQTNPTCSAFTPDSCANRPLNFDFSYKQDVCNPLSVQFFSVGNNLQSPYWGFSDGGSSTGNFTPVHTFPATGNYTVKYSVTDGITRDTVTKIIPVNVVRDNIILTPDTTICNGASKLLSTVPSLSFCWTPTTYLDNPNSPNPIASPPNDITYYFNAEVTGNNLIVNGDFSAGNTGFTSQYNYNNPNVTEGEYFIGTNPQTWNGGMSSCRDHTTASGNMMLVNGAPVADVIVWSQTVNVTANTNYAFSTWLQPVHNTNPAQLQFAINGKLVGNLIVATLPACTWTQFYTTWNSGSNTTAVISIVNKNQQIAGNDFALDDISFAPVFIKRDSVHITIDKPVINASADTAICSGGSAQLNTNGASTYSWTPTTGLSNASIANPVASPTTTTKYYVTGTTTSGCTAKDSVTVTINDRPTVVVTNNSTVCPGVPFQLDASGGNNYAWSPATGLSDPNIANPSATTNTDITYTVTVTGANTCTNTGTVRLSIRPKPLFTVSAATAVCDGKSTTLTANGGDSYLWSPAAMLNDPTSRTPVATPTSNTTFSVYVSESACSYDTTMTVDVSVNPTPVVSAQKSNDIDCAVSASNLTALGATQYSWTPTLGLDDARKSNPVARINTTTTFTVTGTNSFGCTGTDTVTVKVTNGGRPVFEVPNAFTPNGDRINSCFGIRKWAQVNQLEFIIYNRWGQKVFSTNDPGKCWDGTLNGKPQDSGGYVYVIRAKSACGEVFRKGMVLLLR
jgi:gliding motility-associated-like protein